MVVATVHVPYNVEQDEDGVWSAHASLGSSGGANGDGSTAEEAAADLREAVLMVLEEDGVPVEIGPVPRPQGVLAHVVVTTECGASAPFNPVNSPAPSWDRTASGAARVRLDEEEGQGPVMARRPGWRSCAEGLHLGDHPAVRGAGGLEFLVAFLKPAGSGRRL